MRNASQNTTDSERPKYSLLGAAVCGGVGWGIGTIKGYVEGFLGGLFVPTHLRQMKHDLYDNLLEISEETKKGNIYQSIFTLFETPARMLKSITVPVEMAYYVYENIDRCHFDIAAWTSQGGPTDIEFVIGSYLLLNTLSATWEVGRAAFKHRKKLETLIREAFREKQ